MTDLMKVFFAIDPNDWHGTSVESLWAKPIVGTPDTLLVELQNSPFFARGVSYLDVIRIVEKEGLGEYASTVREGGHSTYRIIREQGPDFDIWWRKLSELGCTYESDLTRRQPLYSVDIPPDADIHAAYLVLEAGETARVWMFEEAHVGHPAVRKPSR